jgi:hypothetical protein
MTAKEMAQKVIAELPDTATLDEIQYHLYVLECIQRGEEDIINGRTMTDLEVRKGLEKWLK